MRSRARERRLDERADRAAADLTRPVDVERAHRRRRQRRARSGTRAPCARRRASRRRRSSAPRRRSRSSSRAPRRTLNACWPKTSLVEKSTTRSTVSLRRERRLEHVVRADHVHAHRPHGALEHRVHAGDRRAVDDVRRAGERSPRAASASSTSPCDEREVRVVGERRAAERVAVEVVDGDDLVVVDEPPRERRADESRAAGDDDALSAQSHAGESMTARSRATLGACAESPSSRSASSHSSPARRVHGGHVGRRRRFASATGRTAPAPSPTRSGRCGASPARGSLPRPARACTKLGAGGAKLVRATPAGHRLHGDLRRPAARAGRRDGRGKARVGDAQPHERLRDQPLGSGLARGSCRRAA